MNTALEQSVPAVHNEYIKRERGREGRKERERERTPFYIWRIMRISIFAVVRIDLSLYLRGNKVLAYTESYCKGSKRTNHIHTGISSNKIQRLPFVLSN